MVYEIPILAAGKLTIKADTFEEAKNIILHTPIGNVVSLSNCTMKVGEGKLVDVKGGNDM